MSNQMCKLRNDLTGKTFNKLTVIQFVSNKPVKYRCKCVCGNVCIVNAMHLTSGHTKSCGCQKIESARKQNFKDLTGQRFGRLVVVERGPNYKGGAKWWCDCDCGNKTLVPSNTLLEGGSSSCGCYRLDQLRKAITTHGMSDTKEYKAMQSHKRRELERLHESEITLDLEIELKKFFPTCVICGSTENLSKDHVLPLSKGNGLKPGNAVVLCISCNSSKNDKDITELPLEDQVSLIWNAFRFKDYYVQPGHKKCAYI